MTAEAGRRLSQGLQVAVFLVATLTFAIAAFLPVYIDEIGWKMQLGRMFFDGGETIATTSTPNCGRYAFPIPVLFLPYRLIDGTVYRFFDDPIFLRVTALPITLLTIAAIGWALSRLFAPVVGRATVLAGTVAFVTLGVLPLGLALSRPEQLLLPMISLLTIASVQAERRPPERLALLRPLWKDWGIAFTVGFCGSLLLASHPKSMYFLPVLVAAGLALPQRRMSKLFALGFLTTMLFCGYSYWKLRLACPFDASVRGDFESRTLYAAIAGGALKPFLMAQLSAGPAKFTYIWLIQFRKRYMADWLPAGTMSATAHGVNIAIEFLYLALLILGIGAFVLLLIRTIRTRSLPSSVATVGGLWASLGALSLSSGVISDYEGTLMVPLFALAAVLSLWLGRSFLTTGASQLKLALAARGAFMLLAGTSVASQLVLIGTFTPHLKDWRKASYVDGQAHSVSLFGYGRLRQDILAAAALCGIAPDTGGRHIVIDELTYFAFMKTYQPVLMNYISPTSWGRSIASLPTLLAAFGSDGAVTACRSVPASLLAGTKAYGQFCCHPSFRSELPSAATPQPQP